MTLVGIDIGGSSVKGVLLREGAITRDAQSASYTRPDIDTLRGAFTSVADALLDDAACAQVGICTPGILDADGNTVKLSVNLPGLNGMHLPTEMHRVFAGQPRVDVLPDACASAFGHWSAARSPGRMLALVIGTGIGACVLDDGVPLHVVDGSPGHIGQIDVGHVGTGPAPIGPDGGRGSLEAFIGAAALTERFGSDRLQGWLDAPDDDPAFLALARAIRICHAIYRPTTVALLGGVGLRLAPRHATIRALVEDHLTGVASPEWTLEFGMSDHAGALGAALMAEQRVS
ncbi:MAG: ROK family protein [Planctomycetota bacterium]